MITEHDILFGARKEKNFIVEEEVCLVTLIEIQKL